MINRTIAPQINDIDHINFVKPHIFDIANGVKLYFLKEVPNETSRIDLHFNAGTINGIPALASIVNGLLLSGTKDKTSTQIHESIDDLGGFYESGISNENAVITIYALRENLTSILEILIHAIENLAFHPHEVEELINDRKQKFKVNLEKVSFLAQRSFQQHLFFDTVYGKVVNEQDFNKANNQQIQHFFRQHYLKGLTKVVVVGELIQDEIDRIIDLSGKLTQEGTIEFEKNIQNLKGKIHIEKKDALQTAIRVGRILFNKKHEDFNDFLILNTILGDYFGSRLMSNIREDKGYTYGIGSMVAELHETGYFLIATEVGKAVTEETLKEIKIELERLQNELIDIEELELVKKYMLGQLLKSADGPYAMMDLFMGVEPFNMDLEYYNHFIHSIKNITPERIQSLAQMYLNWKDMTIVSAG